MDKRAKEIEKEEKLWTTREVCDFLNISQTTLYKLDKQLRPGRTPGGHRRYSKKMIEEWLETTRR